MGNALENARAEIQAKFVEYQELFRRFKAGENLTGEELTRMSDLSDELQKLSAGQAGEMI